MYTLSFGNYEFPNQTFEIDGLPLDANVQESRIPQRHGSIVQDSYLNSRKIRIAGTIHSASAAISYAQLLEMQAALLVKEEKAFKYRSDSYINARTKNLKSKFVKGSDKAIMNIDVEMAAQNPFQYSDGLSYSDIENTDGTTKAFDLYNGGNAFSEPNIYICAVGGTIIDDIELTNLTNSHQLKYRGTLNNGLTLEIDCAEGTLKNNNISDMANFEGDFVTIPAGTNSFQFVGMTCRITTEHKYRWY